MMDKETRNDFAFMLKVNTVDGNTFEFKIIHRTTNLNDMKKIVSHVEGTIDDYMMTYKVIGTSYINMDIRLLQTNDATRVFTKHIVSYSLAPLF